MAERGRRVVLVGKRRPALEAAARLGLDVVLWSDRPPSAGEAGLVARWVAMPAASPGAPPSAAEADAVVSAAAREIAGGGAPAAVLALTEGTVPAAARLRAALGAPGMGLEASRRCSDKERMKSAIRAAGLPCAAVATHGEGLTRDEIAARLGLPVYLKPRLGWGSRGARRIDRVEDLPEGVPRGYLAEARVDGEEMSVEALVADGEPVFINPTEYLDAGWANLVPRSLDPATRAAVERLLRGALAALGVARGVVHLELFLTAAGPVFGELAARPPGGYIFRLIELAYGFDLWEAWLGLELGQGPGDLPAPSAHSGVRLLHPGAGRVLAVEGIEAARAVPGIVEARVRVKPGAELGPRLGWGSESGRLVARAASRDEVIGALETAHRLLRIEVG